MARAFVGKRGLSPPASWHGFTLSRAVAFGYVKSDEINRPDFVLGGKYIIDFAGKPYPAKALLEPPFVPKNEKIRV